MKDYFAEFILNPQAAMQQNIPSLGNLASSGKAPMKHHFMWAILSVAIGYGSWKASQWCAAHKFLTQNKG